MIVKEFRENKENNVMLFVDGVIVYPEYLAGMTALELVESMSGVELKKYIEDKMEE